MTDPRRARYVALFVAESQSLLSGARRALADWLDAPSESGPAEELFRTLHTIKGMAGSLGFDALTELTHATETELAEVRGGERTADRAWIAQLERRLDDVAVACDAAVEAETIEPDHTSTFKVVRPPRIVRVDLDRLDALIEDLGGLVTARQELERQAEHDTLSPVARAATTMARRLDALQDRILHVRLAPLTEVFERIPPIVRDLARQLGKDVTVELTGGDIEVDRAILDQLAEPMIHLLRNAVDHGIELPADRRSSGKRASGKVAVQARRERDAVILELIDDGRGIDRDRVAASARDQGILDSGSTLTDDGLLAILSRPGFSTATSVTDVSGRGVGLDAVVARLHAMGAAMAITTVPGHGTVFSIRLPTRLGIMRAMVTGIGDERYVMPLTHVAELVAYQATNNRDDEGRILIDVHGEPVPVVDLRRLLLYRGPPPPLHRPAIVIEANGQRIAMLADAVHGQFDAVVQPIDRPAGMPRWITGATVLDDGRPALLLDLASVV
ncbi:MAG: chemotaxis protein CheW [Gemmatimonadales bacterium]